MLISKLVEIDGLISSCEMEEQLAKTEKMLNNIYAAVEGYNANLNKLKEIVEALSGFQSDSELYEEISGILIDHFNKMKVEVKGKIENEDYNFMDLLQDLSYKLGLLVIDANEKWKQKINDITEQNMVILKILAGMLNSHEINEALKNMDHLRKSEPSIKNLQKIRDIQNSTEQIISRLGLNQDIISFLRKVYRREAILSDLTDEIIYWCRKNKIDSKLKITLNY